MSLFAGVLTYLLTDFYGGSNLNSFFFSLGKIKSQENPEDVLKRRPMVVTIRSFT